MKLTERNLSDLSDLQYRILTCPLPSRSQVDAVVVAFEGDYRFGGSGNPDAHFMAVIIEAALMAWGSSALVVDLRKLTYEWGDAIAWAVFRRKRGFIPSSAMKPTLPTAVIVSEHNRERLTSLIVQFLLDKEPSKWLFDTLEEAMNAVEEQYEVERGR